MNVVKLNGRIWNTFSPALTNTRAAVIGNGIAIRAVAATALWGGMATVLTAESRTLLKTYRNASLTFLSITMDKKHKSVNWRNIVCVMHVDDRVTHKHQATAVKNRET